MKEAEYTVEFNKVFINLASLLLGTSLVFVVNITNKNQLSLGLLVASWIFWTISIYLGAQAIGEISNIVGDAEIEEKKDPTKFACATIADKLENKTLTSFIKGQMWLFLFGFAALIVNAVVRIYS